MCWNANLDHEPFLRPLSEVLKTRMELLHATKNPLKTIMKLFSSKRTSQNHEWKRKTFIFSHKCDFMCSIHTWIMCWNANLDHEPFLRPLSEVLKTRMELLHTQHNRESSSRMHWFQSITWLDWPRRPLVILLLTFYRHTGKEKSRLDTVVKFGKIWQKSKMNI